MIRVELKAVDLELKVNWKISRNESLTKKNYFLSVTDGPLQGVGEVAPNIRYGENEEKILSDFKTIQALQNLSLDSFYYEIFESDLSNSFKFALESALIHLECQKNKTKVWEHFNLSAPTFLATSFSIPIMDPRDIQSYLERNSGFHFYKLKVCHDTALELVEEVVKHIKVPLRIDGNEAWSNLDDYKKFEEKIKKYNIDFIEQPFKDIQVDDYIALKNASAFKIMGDESIEAFPDFELIQKKFHMVNVKLMKAGSYKNGIALLKTAKSLGLSTMIGCMIESSLGISSALNISSLGDCFDLDGSLLISNDPYDFITLSKGMLSLKN